MDIDIHIHTHVCLYIYIYIYIKRERERYRYRYTHYVLVEDAVSPHTKDPQDWEHPDTHKIIVKNKNSN